MTGLPLMSRFRFHVARQEIGDEVRSGLRAGRVSVDRPQWVRLSPRSNPQLGYSEAQRYVWDEARTRAWVVLKDGNTVVVRTGLARTLRTDAGAS